MIHFIRSGASIAADHIDDLTRHFANLGIEYQVHDRRLDEGDTTPGHVYVSANTEMIRNPERVAHEIFRIQLPHNLTGLKGIHFGQSDADFNLLSGPRIARIQGIDLTDPKFEVAGYAKWDRIYQERNKVGKRRQELAVSMGLRTQLPWVIFYPTGPSKQVAGNQRRGEHIHKRVFDDLGPHEFIYCNHARTKDYPECAAAVQRLLHLSELHEGIHVLDGLLALPAITACDLFITDIASTVITALSMNKPIAFIRTNVATSATGVLTAQSAQDFQCSPALGQIPNLPSFIDGWKPTPALQELFAGCVAFDDDSNCRRIADRILEKISAWKKG